MIRVRVHEDQHMVIEPLRGAESREHLRRLSFLNSERMRREKNLQVDFIVIHSGLGQTYISAHAPQLIDGEALIPRPRYSRRGRNCSFQRESQHTLLRNKIFPLTST